MKWNWQSWQWPVLAVYVALLAFISRLPRSDFSLLIAASALAFVLWWVVYRNKRHISILWFIVAFVLLRLPFFLELPLLSDDFYRFLWDGLLIHSGVNPFGAVPVETFGILPAGTDMRYAAELLAHMNSAPYPSVYPTLHQAVFAVAAWFGGSDILAGVNVIRGVFVGVEAVVAVFLYRRLAAVPLAYFLYLLNPLTVVEGLGNVHFEAMMVPLFAVMVWACRSERTKLGAISWAAAILVKLNPLILAPTFLFRMRARRRWTFFAWAAGVVIIGLVLLRPWTGFAAVDGGMSLYFRSFEFNASIYYLLRQGITAIIGYNPIAWLGPALGVGALLAIVLWAFLKRRAVSLPEVALGIYILYLLFATTVHPWYVIPVLYFALAAGRPLIAIWSFAAFLSYAHYLPPIGPKAASLFVEYGLLAAALWMEHRRRSWFADE